MTSTRLGKVRRRTLVGSTITVLLVAVLLGAHAIGSGWPILVATAALTSACVWEVGRMGTLAGRGLAWVLAVPALATVLGYAGAVRAFEAGTPQERELWASFASHSILWDHAWAGLWALIAFGCLWATRGLGRWKTLARAFVAVALGFAVARIVYAPAQPPETRTGILVAAGIVLAWTLIRGREARRELLLALLLALWMIVPLPALTRVWYLFGEGGLIALLVTSKLGDSAAYYVGNALGRHHPFPSISPGKTSEGCIASLATGILAGIGCVALGWLPREPWGLVGGALAGALINLAAQAGDLLESWVKRRAGVKDSGPWFGPSGGFLDLVDSLLLSVPVALLLWPHIFAAAGA